MNGAIDINRKLQDVQKDKQKLGMWLHIANNVILKYQLSSQGQVGFIYLCMLITLHTETETISGTNVTFFIA